MSDTRDYFNAVAPQWDAMSKQFFGDGVRRAAIAAAGIGPGCVVADIGTGTGFLAEAAIDAGARVIGVDLSEGMLRQVSARLAGRPFEARQSIDAEMPLADNEVDAVVANMFLHHAEDPPATIGQLSRALKPGDASSSQTPIRTRMSGCVSSSTTAGWDSTAPTWSAGSPTPDSKTSACITRTRFVPRRPTAGRRRLSRSSWRAASNRSGPPCDRNPDHR